MTLTRGGTTGICGTIETIWARVLGSVCIRSAPWKWTVPSAGMIPAIARSKLDFPDPLGPIMESQSPE